MCLGLPGQVISSPHGDLSMARVSFAGVVKDVSLVYVPEAGIGDYVIVHAGFAISRVDEQAARRTLAWLEEAGEP